MIGVAATTGLTRWRRRGAMAGLGMCLLRLDGLAMALGNAIESVEPAAAGASTRVTVTLKEAPARLPRVFSTPQPARIAIDFFDTELARGRVSHAYEGGLLRAAHAVQIGDRSRVILELARAARFASEMRGNQYVMTLDRAGTPAASFATSPAAFAAQTRQTDVPRLAVRHIDFRRAEASAGRVIIDLSAPGAAINVAQQGRNLVVDLDGATLPQSLRRRYDVSDFGTPVQALRAADRGAGARLIIEPSGSWRHSAYQTDTQFVVEIRPAPDAARQPALGSDARAERLSLNFQNIEVRALLQVFAEFTHLNLVTSDSVTGTLSLRLKDVPWDQALQIVLDARGLTSRRSGNVLWIAPRHELAAREKAELEARHQVDELEPLRSQVFRLNYQHADDVRDMLLGAGKNGQTDAAGAMMRLLSKRGALISDPRTNQLFVSDLSSRLEAVQAFIQKIDIPVRQVMIEARIVEADDAFSRNLGVKLGFASRTGGAGIGNTFSSVTPSGGKLEPSPALSFPAGSLHGLSAASVAVSLFNAAAGRFLALELSALEADGRGKIISRPRVVTADNIKALIEQGTELPYQAATSSGATSVQFRKANLKLEVTPKITPDGNVFLNVDVNKDSVGVPTTHGFAIDTKHVQTQVLVENGGTVVIGGIYMQTERADVSQVPVLGKIPVLGNLFRNTARIRNRTELLVFLTPRVLSDQLSLN